MSSTGFVFHPLFLEHDTGPRHPEQPARLTAILEHLEATALGKRLVWLEPRPASVDAIGRVHDAEYVAGLAARCAERRRAHEDPDTVRSPATYRAALLAAGAVLTAIDAVIRGEVQNAFCAVRPPGHHAERDHAMGFCFFNNVAIGARHAQAVHGLSRIAIVDWDVHHGNGTQHAFEEDPAVLFISLHQYPWYPGSGRRDEQGRGAGAGYTINVPMPAGATDTDYLRVFHEELRPTLERFRPELVLISAGFDGHRADPLASIQLTEDGYAALTREVCAVAAAHAQGRVVSVLEGGYNLEVLPRCVAAHLQALMGA